MWPCSLSTEHPFFPSSPYPHHTPARAFPLSDPRRHFERLLAAVERLSLQVLDVNFREHPFWALR
jgi:hypothetical protein